MSVLFGDSIENIRGSLSSERSSGIDKHYLLNQKIHKMRTLNSKYKIPLSAGPEKFYEKLSEVTALHPEFPIAVSIGGLSVFEGKNSQKKIFQLLLYMATLGREWFFLQDILLERIVSRYFNRKEENLGKIGGETRQLLLVFGSVEVRQRYLKERYSERKLADNIKIGEKLFGTLYIRYFDASPVRKLQRKHGYNDHGSLKANHEYHGEKEIEEMSIEETKKSVQEILLEIYEESTLNYLEWLKKTQKVLNEQSKEQENKIPIQEEVNYDRTIKSKN